MISITWRTGGHSGRKALFIPADQLKSASPVFVNYAESGLADITIRFPVSTGLRRPRPVTRWYAVPDYDGKRSYALATGCWKPQVQRLANIRAGGDWVIAHVILRNSAVLRN